MKRITGRRKLRCNHTLSDAYALESVVSHTVRATFSQTRLMQISLYVDLCFSNYEWISNFTHSKPIKISLKCMNETKKKDYKKCSHYIIGAYFFFFWFKYLFFVILFYYDMFIISSSGGGDWNVGGGGTQGRGVERSSSYTNWHVHIHTSSLF